jgi:DNA-binding NtrC family response regulator
MDGLGTLAEVKKLRPDQVVIMLKSQGSFEMAVIAWQNFHQKLKK